MGSKCASRGMGSQCANGTIIPVCRKENLESQSVGSSFMGSQYAGRGFM